MSVRQPDMQWRDGQFDPKGNEHHPGNQCQTRRRDIYQSGSHDSQARASRRANQPGDGDQQQQRAGLRVDKVLEGHSPHVIALAPASKE